MKTVGFDSRRATRLGRSRFWRATGTSFISAPLRIPFSSLCKKPLPAKPVRAYRRFSERKTAATYLMRRLRASDYLDRNIDSNLSGAGEIIFPLCNADVLISYTPNSVYSRNKSCCRRSINECTVHKSVYRRGLLKRNIY